MESSPFLPYVSEGEQQQQQILYMTYGFINHIPDCLCNVSFINDVFIMLILQLFEYNVYIMDS